MLWKKPVWSVWGRHRDSSSWFFLSLTLPKSGIPNKIHKNTLEKFFLGKRLSSLWWSWWPRNTLVRLSSLLWMGMHQRHCLHRHQGRPTHCAPAWPQVNTELRALFSTCLLSCLCKHLHCPVSIDLTIQQVEHPLSLQVLPQVLLHGAHKAGFPSQGNTTNGTNGMKNYKTQAIEFFVCGIQAGPESSRMSICRRGLAFTPYILCDRERGKSWHRSIISDAGIRSPDLQGYNRRKAMCLEVFY